MLTPAPSARSAADLAAAPLRRARHLIAVGDARVGILETGVLTAPTTYVLVHGLGMSMRYFTDLADELGRDSRVLRVDLHGFGTRSHEQGDLNIPEHADALVDALRGIPRRAPESDARETVFVGQSMGCQVVVDAVARYSHAADRAVLIGPTTDPRRRSLLGHAARLAVDSTREPWRANKVVVREYARAGVRRYLVTAAFMFADRIEHKLSRVRVPTLVVRGAQDMIARDDWVQRMAHTLPYGSWAQVPGAPHLAQITHPITVAELCRRGTPTP